MPSRLIAALLFVLIATVTHAQAQPPGAGLIVHLKADAGVAVTGSVVDSWTDQSGNGFQFSPPGATGPEFVANVVNGLPALRFDGTVQLEGDLGQTLGPATIVSLAQHSVISSDNDYLYAVGNSGTSGGQMTLSRLSGDLIYHYDGSVANSPADTCVPPFAFMPVVQVYGDATPQSHEVYQNGVLELSTTANAAYAADAGSFIIGNWSGGSFRFTGDLVELLVYDRALSAAERAQADAYLRERAGIDYQNLGSFSTVQYEFNQQSDAQWTTCGGDTVANQSVNADASILLGDDDVVNTVLRGSMRAGNAPDYMGFVIGYQERGSYYLFDWRKTLLSFAGWGPAEPGMSLRIIDVPGGADPGGQDLWASADTVNVTTLCDNPMPWANDVIYDFTVRFVPGQIGIDVRDGDTLLESWSIADATFDQGRFGFYINSLQGVEFGPLTLETALSADTDGDGVLDVSDNCVDDANSDQRDTDGDGIGNRCDADINNDCIVNAVDLGLLKLSFFSSDDDTDFSGDGVVNAVDLGIMKSLFFQPPGPSGLPHACGC